MSRTYGSNAASGKSQALARDGGRGVSDDAMRDAVENPVEPPEEQASPQGPNYRYEGENAVVVLNQNDKVVTTSATGIAGVRTIASVVEQIPDEFRSLFEEVLTIRNPELLHTLNTQAKPTLDQRRQVDKVFSSEIIDQLDQDDELTDRGQRAKRTIEEFWCLWPRETT